MAIIEEHGEAAVRVKDLCDDVGVAVTSLYHFFGSREGLIEAAQVERYGRELRRASSELAHQVALCRSQREFRTLIRRTLDVLCSSERAGARMNRVNVLGSAQGRPELAQALAVAQAKFHDDLGRALQTPRDRGWIRPDIDLPTLSAWLFGLVTGRVLIEIGDTHVDERAWNRFAHDAVNAVLFGEVRSARSAA